jgi:hypothetical protein
VFACIAFFSLYAVAASAGQVYKWVDEKGVVTFGDQSQRPESTAVETIKIDTQNPAPEAEDTPEDAANADKAAKDAAAKQKQAAEKAAAEAPRMPAAEKRKRCAEARSDLATFQSHGRMREADAKGNVTYMSEAQKQARMKSLNKNIAEYCR